MANNTWQYVIGIIAIVILIIWNYYTKFIEWIWFLIIGIIIIAGYYIIQNIIKKRNQILTVPEKKRLATENALEMTNDWLYYAGYESLDLDDDISSQIVEDRAFEETLKTDTPVVYIHTIHKETKDKYDIIIRSEENEIFRKLKKMCEEKIKNKIYYRMLIDNINITILKNFPYFGKDKQNAIRNFINSYAAKSGLGVYTFDPKTKMYKRQEIIESPIEKEDEEEEE